MMLSQVSDYLFMGSLVLLIITFFLHGAGIRGFTDTGAGSGAATDLNMEHEHQKLMQRQDSLLSRMIRSYFFWIAIAGILVSVVLSKL
ncbi:hypothetical protein [Paenibacillus sedimenti]|uniref:Uncharacterized protein n=1 Tax=Paenibacillus sedimenti TaxID=2770274 RepID=A0A926QIQ4_9BACL|nr:hypothetical protein [Paenibacillus sedimenti]MBD0379858.1 hypothetical protein [Paenibacillus sedimenti]